MSYLSYAEGDSFTVQDTDLHRLSAQYRFLADETKCGQTEHRYGIIQKKVVRYRGETLLADDIQYQNVEEFLETL